MNSALRNEIDWTCACNRLMIAVKADEMGPRGMGFLSQDERDDAWGAFRDGEKPKQFVRRILAAREAVYAERQAKRSRDADVALSIIVGMMQMDDARYEELNRRAGVGS